MNPGHHRILQIGESYHGVLWIAQGGKAASTTGHIGDYGFCTVFYDFFAMEILGGEFAVDCLSLFVLLDRKSSFHVHDVGS